MCIRDRLLSGAGATGTRLAGDFVLEIFKTVRGFGGSAICASQDLNDFFNLDEGRFGKGIINNSKTKIILNLEDDEMCIRDSSRKYPNSFAPGFNARRSQCRNNCRSSTLSLFRGWTAEM